MYGPIGSKLRQVGLLTLHDDHLIDNSLNYDLRPTGPAILPPVGPTGPPKDEMYA